MNYNNLRLLPQMTEIRKSVTKKKWIIIKMLIHKNMFVPSMTSNIEHWRRNKTRIMMTFTSFCMQRLGSLRSFSKSKSARDHSRHLAGLRMIKSMFSVHTPIYFLNEKWANRLDHREYEYMRCQWPIESSAYQFYCLRTFFCVDDLIPLFL